MNGPRVMARSNVYVSWQLSSWRWASTIEGIAGSNPLLDTLIWMKSMETLRAYSHPESVISLVLMLALAFKKVPILVATSAFDENKTWLQNEWTNKNVFQ